MTIPKSAALPAKGCVPLLNAWNAWKKKKKALSSDIKDIFAEAKSAGFDVKVLRAVIRLRKQEPAEVEEQETLLDLYRRALGM